MAGRYFLKHRESIHKEDGQGTALPGRLYNERGFYTMDKKQLRNTLLLICAAFIWGTAFVAQSVGSGYMGAYTFLASRSWLACVFLMGMLLVRRAGQKKRGSGLPFWIHGNAACAALPIPSSAECNIGRMPLTMLDRSGKLSVIPFAMSIHMDVSSFFAGRN